jgi:tRNA threonylcarbamoyl adenosine modification protein YjeE
MPRDSSTMNSSNSSLRPTDRPSTTMAIATEEALGPLAAALVAALPPAAFIALRGDLGAGKTTFVKHVAAAAGIDPVDVVSPTFGLIHVYPRGGLARHAVPHGRLVHADMYRLGDPGELRETGWEDAIAGDAWVFLEWPERIGAALPADRLDIEIGITSPTGREFVCTSHGPRHDAVVESLRGRRYDAGHAT